MMARASLCVGVLCGVLLVAASGCGSSGPKLEKVTGKVTLDGQPLAGANVNFEPEDYSTGLQAASGRTGTDGTYSLSTFTSGDGAMVGKYKVTITKTAEADQSAGGQPGNMNDPNFMIEMAKKMAEKSQSGKGAQQKPRLEIHSDYSDLGKTILKMTVPPPDGRADFALKKGGGL